MAAHSGRRDTTIGYCGPKTTCDDLPATSSRTPYGQGSFYAYYEKNDPKKRLLVIADYSQDVGDAWQWSGTGFMPIDVSNEAFKLGVNYVIYALTH